jgi:asparagine synthase (glutamine-hydrolysing)
VIRFVALSWNPSQAEHAEALSRRVRMDVRKWRCLTDGQGFALWAIDPHPRAFQNSDCDKTDGWILGRAFRRGRPADASLTTGQLPEDAGAGRIGNLGKFVSDWWGGYVLFGGDAANRYVFRDPTGALPCWQIDLEGVKCWFADIGDLRRIFDPRLTVSKSALAAHLQLSKLGKAVSCLEQVEPLLPAAAVPVTQRPSANPVFAWNPARFSADPVPDLASATDLVRNAVEEVLGAYARHYSSPLISVGGLDSSILWSTARALELENVRGFSLFSRSERGDERDYVSSLPGQDRLDFLPMDGERIDPAKVFAPSATVDPPGFADLVELSWDRAALSGTQDFDLLIYGVGGDNVFLQGAGITGALDYGASKAPLAGIWKAAADSARYSKRWHPAVLAAALQQRLRKRTAGRAMLMAMMPAGEDFLPDLPMLGATALQHALHPLLLTSLELPPGKAMQTLSSCFCASDYFDPWEGEGQVERCEFYLSQPIVEACLRIPSWLLAIHGIERGLARLAFADILPDKVVRRMTKGTPEDVYAEFLTRHRSAIHDYLFSGSLVDAGLLKQERIAEALGSKSKTEFVQRAHPIIQLLSLESWLRNWVQD